MNHKLEWFEFPGKSTSQKTSVSDGYIAEFPCASVTVLAARSDGDIAAAKQAVAIIRDTFSEGVIWEPGETLRDSVTDAMRETGCPEEGRLSLAAIAVAGDNAWILMQGDCRALIPNIKHGVGLEAKGEHSSNKVKHITLDEKKTVILLSPTLGRLVDNIGQDWKFRLKKHEYSTMCIRRLLDDTKGEYRISGGSIILLGKFPEKNVIHISGKTQRIIFWIISMFILLLIFIICTENTGNSGTHMPGEFGVPVLPLREPQAITEEDSIIYEYEHLYDDTATIDSLE